MIINPACFFLNISLICFKSLHSLIQTFLLCKKFHVQERGSLITILSCEIQSKHLTSLQGTHQRTKPIRLCQLYLISKGNFIYPYNVLTRRMLMKGGIKGRKMWNSFDSCKFKLNVDNGITSLRAWLKDYFRNGRKDITH